MDVVQFRMLFSQALERIYSAKAGSDDAATKHVGGFLVTIVQQTSVCGLSLMLSRGRLSLCHPTTPNSEHKCYRCADKKTDVSNCCTVGLGSPCAGS